MNQALQGNYRGKMNPETLVTSIKIKKMHHPVHCRTEC